MLKYLIVVLAVVSVVSAGSISLAGLSANYAVSPDLTLAFPIDISELPLPSAGAKWECYFNSTGFTAGTGVYLDNWVAASANVNFTVNGVDSTLAVPRTTGKAVAFMEYTPATIGLKALLKNNLKVKTPGVGTKTVYFQLTSSTGVKTEKTVTFNVLTLSSASVNSIAMWAVIAFSAILSVIALF